MPRVEAPPRRAVLALAVAALSGCANLSGPILAPAELEREGFVAAVRERRLAQWLDGGLLPTSCAA